MIQHANLDAAVDYMRHVLYDPSEKSKEDHYADKEVHISSIKEHSAYECAKKILNHYLHSPLDAQEEDGLGHNYYGIRGDGWAEGITPDAQWREITVKYPLKDGWQLVGTTDAGNLTADTRLIFVECKFHNAPRSGVHDEKAFRQAMLELTIWWKQHQEGRRHWPASKFEYQRVNHVLQYLSNLTGREYQEVKPPDLDLRLGDGIRPEGVNVRIGGTRTIDQCMSKGWHYTESLGDEILEFYVAKGNAIVEAVDTEDLEIAKSFDYQFPQEQYVPFQEMHDPPGDVKEVLMDWHRTRDMKREAERRYKEEIQHKAKLLFAKGKMEEGKVWLDEEIGYFAIVKPPKKVGYVPDVRFYGEPLEAEA